MSIVSVENWLRERIRLLNMRSSLGGKSLYSITFVRDQGLQSRPEPRRRCRRGEWHGADIICLPFASFQSVIGYQPGCYQVSRPQSPETILFYARNRPAFQWKAVSMVAPPLSFLSKHFTMSRNSITRAVTISAPALSAHPRAGDSPPKYWSQCSRRAASLLIRELGGVEFAVRHCQVTHLD